MSNDNLPAGEANREPSVSSSGTDHVETSEEGWAILVGALIVLAEL